MISKALNRADRSLLSISQEVGIPVTTLVGWLPKHDKAIVMKKQKSSNKWNPEQKLRALLETASLAEAELGVYLRKGGLFSHQLEDWKKEFLSSMVVSRQPKIKKDERDKKIKTLEREILRKDKALAEAAALIILQKKVNLLWGNQDEGEK